MKTTSIDFTGRQIESSDPQIHGMKAGGAKNAAYQAENRAGREESERFKRFGYDELIARDKVSLDLIWLRDESLEDMENLPPPEVIAQEIVEDLEAALAEFSAIAQSLGRPEPA